MSKQIKHEYQRSQGKEAKDHFRNIQKNYLRDEKVFIKEKHMVSVCRVLHEQHYSLTPLDNRVLKSCHKPDCKTKVDRTL